MARPLLSAALIVRNEEGFLAACLESLAGIADEVVIADTGSTDRSRDIARAHGARLLDCPWRGDFSAARNAALDAAGGDWILYIDADERLLPVDRAAVEAMLAPADMIAARLWLRPRAGYTFYREYRLFRNDPGIRFEGIIHEKVSPAIHRVAERRGMRIGEVELRLDHAGYDGPQDHKHRRNLPLLQAELALRPDNAYNWHHLGRTLDGLGDRAGALDAWRRSLEVVRRCGVERSSDWVVYVELIRAGETSAAQARKLLSEATPLFPGNPLLRFCAAMLEIKAGNHAAAIPLLSELAAIDGERYSEPLTAFDKRLFGEHAWAALGACCFALGQYAESAAWYAKAAAADPRSLEYRVKHGLAAAKAGSREAETTTISR